MTPTIRLLAAGGSGVPRLDEAAGAVCRSLGLSVRVEKLALDLRPAYDGARGQYCSTILLAGVIALGGPPEEKRIAVVDVDLFVPALSFVFGEAQLAGCAAVVSTQRLANQFYGLPRDDALLAHRLIKETVHELGHTLGLYHCRQFECVMRSSTYVEEIDLKREMPCPQCRGLLQAVAVGG